MPHTLVVGDKVLMREPDGKIRILLRVFTDTVGENAVVLDQARFDRTCERAAELVGMRQDIDGIQIEPLKDRR